MNAAIINLYPLFARYYILTHTGVCKIVLQLALSFGNCSDGFLTTTAEGLNINMDVLQTASEE